MADPTRLRRFVRSAFMVVVFGGMVLALDRMLRSYSYADVSAGFAKVTPRAVVIAIGLVAVQYTVLVGREWLAVTYAGRGDLGLSKTALASMIARPLSTLGVATITGLGLRTRIYGAWGATGKDIGLITAYNETTYYVGLATTCGVVFTAARAPYLSGLSVRLPPTWIIGVLGLLAATGYVVWCARRKTPITIRTVEIPVPGGVHLAGQLVFPVIDLLLGAAVVHAVMPASAGLPYVELVAVVLIANLASSLSQVPAGLGVFEAVVLELVAPGADESAVLGALLVRRILSTLLPMVFGAMLLIVFEVRRRAADHRHEWHDDTIATAVAVMTFASGVAMLVFGTEPTIRAELAPGGLPALLSFVLGVVILVVARGLQRRTRRAWFAALGLLVVRGVAEVATGHHGPVLAIVVAQTAVLIASRRVFSARGVLLHEEVASWWAAFAMAIIGTIGVAGFAEGDRLTRLGALRLVAVVVITSLAGGIIGYRFATRHRRASPG